MALTNTTLSTHPDFPNISGWIIPNLLPCYLKTDEKIIGIYLFTAHVQWDQQKVSRHKLLISALLIQNVEIVFGKFKKKEKHLATSQFPDVIDLGNGKILQRSIIVGLTSLLAFRTF